jgi:outer membrane protein OmpA-like peptidoglycan-associated protein
MTVDDSDGRFAYQAIAGLAFPLSVAPGLALTAEYRFLGTLQPSLNVRFENPATGATVATGTVEPDSYNQSVMLGLRYAFGAASAAPAPAPAAAPVQQRSFIVFFDWNRADLTERARQIVAEAAQQTRAQRTTRIEVAGHADRSGTVQYNQALSRRRAEAVAAELVRLGVAREEIIITALGESQPLVATADDAREPQNRRVEIILR